MVLLAWGSAAAQTDLPDSLKNRPPAAAPTSQIDVAPIEVVRSMSEVVNDFGGGLIQGLLASHGLRNAALVAAQDSRIIADKSFDCCISFTEFFYSDFLAPVAAMQLVERQRLRLDEALAQALVSRTDPAALRRLVEASSGQDFRSYVSQNILSPLSAGAGGQPDSLSEVVGRLLVALLDDGAFEGGRILEPATVERMEQTQFTIHPALPGWSYGFAEMQRNGRRALQRDGVWLDNPHVEARMVVVPEANLAYFVIVEGRAGASFWRTLDDALFDRLLPPQGAPAIEAPQTPAPDSTQTEAVAGLYEMSDEPLALAAPLKLGGRLDVRAADDGSLILSGAENTVLKPRPGGYWAAEDGNLNAVANEGRLILGNGLYRPLRWWKRPELYASLALVSAVGAAGAFVGERRGTRVAKPLARLTPVLVSAVAAFLAIALFAWHLSPVP
jgi:CubicO group peptidase (beta-lactamase class C family)